MDESKNGWYERHKPPEYDNIAYVLRNTQDPILILRAYCDLTPLWEQMQIEAVKEARAEGHSWQEIADAMRRSRQSVWRQFAHLVGEDGEEDPPD